MERGERAECPLAFRRPLWGLLFLGGAPTPGSASRHPGRYAVARSAGFFVTLPMVAPAYA